MKENQFRITFQIPDNDSTLFNYHKGLVKVLMNAVGGTFINESEGSASRYTYKLLTYDVPTVNENFISSMKIDIGSSSNYIIEF
jgi:hypothetical protein